MKRRGVRITAWALAGIAVVVLTGLLVLRTYLTSDFLEDVLNSSLVPATKGTYQVRVGGLSYSLLAGDMVVRDLRVAPIRRTVDQLNARGKAPPVQFSARLEEVSIRDVAVVRLLWQRELVADEFSVSSPIVQIIAIDRSRDGEDGAPDLTEPDSSDAGDETTIDDPLENLRYMAIRKVTIDDVDASLVMVGPYGRNRSETNLTNRLVNLSFNLENLIIDPSRPQYLQRVAFADDARIDFDQLHLELPGEQILDLGPFSSSTRDETIQIGGVSVVPTYSEQEMLNGGGADGDRIEVTVGPVSLDGLDFRRAFSQLSFHANLAYIERFDISVLSDKHRAEPEPESDEPASMPHDVFRDLPFPVTIDTVQFTGAAVTYSERSPEADSPGVITISDINGVVTDLSNDPLVAGPDRPAKINVEGKLFGTTRSWIDIELPLMAPAPTMNLRARFEGFDPTQANAILPPLEGMRVTEGEVDTAWVDISYRPHLATGTVVVIYRDLDVRMEDRDSGKQNFGDKLGSIFADVGLHSANDPEPGKRPRVGKVEYRIELDKPFFQIFWEAVRGGLVNVVKRF